MADDYVSGPAGEKGWDHSRRCTFVAVGFRSSGGDYLIFETNVGGYRSAQCGCTPITGLSRDAATGEPSPYVMVPQPT